MSTYGTDEGDSLTGTSGSDEIFGNGGDDTIRAGGGHDFVVGDLGADLIYGEDGDDQLVAGPDSDPDTLFGGAGADILTGSKGADSLDGGDGNDLIRMARGNRVLGGGGDDRIDADLRDTSTAAVGRQFIDAGAGNDYVVLDFGDYDHDVHVWIDQATSTGIEVRNAEAIDIRGIGFLVTVHGGAADDTVLGRGSIMGGAGNDTLTGGWGPDTLVGGLGDDVLRPNGGNNTIQGGAGFDTVDYSGLNLPLAINMADATHQVGSDYDYYTSIERLIGGWGSDALTGDNRDNTINGGEGGDWLKASLGNDVLIGGAGSDSVSFENMTQALVIDLSTMVVTFDGGSVTALECEGVRGGQGYDTFIGTAGDDFMVSPSYKGTVSYATATAGVKVDLWTGDEQQTGGAGVDHLFGMRGIIGSAFADTLGGGEGADTIRGGDGDDVLLARPFGGNDFWDGGAGFDTLEVQPQMELVTVDLFASELRYAGWSGVQRFSGFEQVVGSGKAELFLAGSGDDWIIGGGAQSGALDRVSYLKATSAVRVNLSLETVQETGGSGADRMADITWLTGSTFDDIFTGGVGATFLNGGDGGDTLISGGGNDVLDGDAGADTISYRRSDVSVTIDLAKGTGQRAGWMADTLVEIENAVGGAGADTLDGSADANRLDGYKGVDVLTGLAGADTLVGGVGRDRLVGGSGGDVLNGGKHGDVFVFLTLTDSRKGGLDRITDLKLEDRIDLSGIDADTTVSGNQAFHLAGAFTGSAGELVRVYDVATNATRILADVNGDKAADLEILVDGDRDTFQGFVL